MAGTSAERLRTLTDLTRELQKERSLEKLLTLIAEHAARLLGVERASIRLLHQGNLMATARAGEPLHRVRDEGFPVDEGLNGWIVRNGEPLLTGNAEEDPRFTRKPGMVARMGSFVGAPLLTSEGCIGVVCAVTEENDVFTDQDVEVLVLLAGMCAPHVQVARLSRLADELQHRVVRDSLTELYNHAYFQDMLERELARAERSGQPLSLLLLDVDHFQAVNESRGHNVGDLCLKAIASLIIEENRRSDVGFRVDLRGVAARYGGDELAIILPDTPRPGAATKAERVRARVEEHSFAELRLPPQTVSIGLAVFPEDATDRTGLVQAATRALTVAKRRGRNGLVCYSPALAVGPPRGLHAQIEIDQLVSLERSIEQESLDFVYQPIVSSDATGTVVAYEALCRPRDRTFTNPADLFQTAERAGRVAELGRVCRRLATRPLDALPSPHLLFVNLHPHELYDPRLADEHEALGAKWPDRLVFEITETAAIEDYDRLRLVIAALRKSGIRVALDDLGAGYAGLNSLALLQPDFVKLDMTLVRDIHTRRASLRLVRHLLEFCTGEGIQVIAEGVEAPEERDAVASLGCHLMQGFLFARPGEPFPAVERDVAGSASG